MLPEELTTEEKKDALHAIKRLCQFEAETRQIRGYGAFELSELPVPALVKLCRILEDEIDGE